MNTITYAGQIYVGDYGDSLFVLFLSDEDQPLAQRIYDDIDEEMVTVRYWVSDKELSEEDIKNEFTRSLFGDCDAQFSPRYSEITGYLYTDEDINIGGHDLLAELSSFKGRWLLLEVDVH